MDAEAKVFMWSETLHPDTTMEDAKKAVVEYYKTAFRPVMPSDINRLTAIYRSSRVNLDLVQIPYPEGLGDEPQLEVAWRAAWLNAIKAGDSEHRATEQAWAAIGRPAPKLIHSTEYVNIKAQLSKFKKNFGKENKNHG